MKNTMMQWRQRALEAERELAELRREVGSEEWLPMETAPTNGENIVVLVRCLKINHETSSLSPAKMLGWRPTTPHEVNHDPDRG